jgi:hypothetical protein
VSAPPPDLKKAQVGGTRGLSSVQAETTRGYRVGVIGFFADEAAVEGWRSTPAPARRRAHG